MSDNYHASNIVVGRNEVGRVTVTVNMDDHPEPLVLSFVPEQAVRVAEGIFQVVEWEEMP